MLKIPKMLILVGGHPKILPIPFHESTKSGRILSEILTRNNLDHQRILIIDLWRNRQEEEQGIISEYLKSSLSNDRDYIVISLGKHVYNCMQKAGIDCRYLPHPASRRRKDVFKLESGICDIVEMELV